MASTSPVPGNSGERFPTCDPEKKAVLEPRPQGRKEFLHGILQVRCGCWEGIWRKCGGWSAFCRFLTDTHARFGQQPQGIARVEREGYDILKVCRHMFRIV